MITATVTLDWKPDDHLVVRLDGRYETSTDEIYFAGEDPSEYWVAGVLGFVATTE